MTEHESAQDSRDSYTEALKALRMFSVIKGEVFPRDDEPIDILLLARIAS